MTPLLAVALLGCAGLLLGGVSGRSLATYGYRLEDDELTGRRQDWWWPAVALGAAWAGLAYAWIGGRSWLTLPAFLLLAWLGVAIAWVDIDVHRIPIGLVVPAALPLTVLVAVPAVVLEGERWRSVLVGMVVWGVLFGLLTLLGGMGAGDTRLAPLVGAVTGLLGAEAAIGALLLTFILGGMWSAALLATRRAGLRSHLAFGPFMVAGALAVGLGQ